MLVTPRPRKAGEFEFRINCALCHGLGAHGGSRGPDLTPGAKETAPIPTQNCFR